MNKELLQTTRYALNSIRRNAEADLLTCYFYNPTSEVYWLFHKDGNFHSPHLLHGPLTHPDQQTRIPESPTIRTEDGVCVHAFGPVFGNEIPAGVTAPILGGESFFSREDVRHLVIGSIEETDGQATGLRVIVFLNYCGTRPPPSPSIDSQIRAFLRPISASLLTLAAEPLLSDDIGWRLRSFEVLLKRKLAALLIASPPSDAKERVSTPPDMDKEWADIFRTILHTLKALVCPKPSSFAAAALFSVTPGNKVRALAAMPEPKTSPELPSGLVRYVAKTGRILVVNDSERYVLEPAGPSHPTYHEKPAKPSRTASAIAFPIVITNRVVGVLSVESCEREAFEERSVLLLFHLAETTALALRQYFLWTALHKVIQECLLIVEKTVKGHKAKRVRDKGIFDALCDATKSIGFHGVVVDLTSPNRWSKPTEEQNIPLSEPRTSGWTHAVASDGKPRALLLTRDEKGGLLLNRVAVGAVDAATRLFVGWDLPRPPMKEEPALNSDLGSYCRQLESRGADPILTDIAMPVYAERGGEVRAVLWATSEREFGALRNDEIWALSLLCSTVGHSLAVSAEVDSQWMFLNKRDANQALLRHFSKTQIDVLNRGFKSEGERDGALSATYAKDIFVLSVDMRGSSRLATAVRDSPKVFKDFISQYHDVARDIVVKDVYEGVFDKTVGDGFQALWNVMRPEVLPGLDTGSVSNVGTSNPLTRAVRCCAEVFREFREMCRVFASQNVGIALPRGFALGGALARGEGFVGSLRPVTDPAFEFSVYGEVANRAGHLVNMARASVVRRALEDANPEFRPVHLLTQAGWTKMPKDECVRLAERLRDGYESILLLDAGLQEQCEASVSDLLSAMTRVFCVTIELPPDDGAMRDQRVVVMLSGNEEHLEEPATASGTSMGTLHDISLRSKSVSPP